MQYVNDDMDEMYRKAAKDYPLDTSGSNFSKVAAALGNDAELSPAKQNRGKMLWLLLLLPMAFVCQHYWNRNDEGPVSSAHKNLRPASGIIANQPASAHPGNELKPGEKEQTTSSEDVAVSNNQTTEPGTQYSSNFKSPVIARASLSHKSSKHSKIQKDLNLPSGMDTYTDFSTTTTDLSTASSASKKDRETIYNGLMTDASRARLQSLPVNGFPHVSDPVGLSAGYDQLVKEQQPIRVSSKSKRVYVGLMAGLDASSIHFQKVENTGYDFGAIVGYHINPRLSVEAGAFVDRKFYYTEGQYFNSAKLYMPPNSKITEVYGNCRMIEIPVAIKYDFIQKRKVTWFATAGISSYLMKKEDYAYEYYYGNSGTYATHRWIYDNSANNLFSVLNISAGYSRPLGRIADLRIEPYLRLPFRGLGYNSIKFSSAGVHVALVKDIF